MVWLFPERQVHPEDEWLVEAALQVLWPRQKRIEEAIVPSLYRIRCETKEAKKENHGKFVDHIKRGSLLLRNVQLTQHGHLSARGKINTKLDVYKIARKKGLVSDGPSSIVPSSWGDMDIGRKQGRGVKRQ